MSDEIPMVPGQTDAAIEKAVEVPAPAPEAEKPEEAKTDPVPEGDPNPDADKPKEDQPKEDEPPINKPRSIYQEYKGEKQARKEAEARAEAAEAELERLRGDKPPEAPAQADKPEEKPADKLTAFAKEKGYDAEELARLAEIITERTPSSQLSSEEKQQLTELTAYKAQKEAEEQRAAEDKAIQAEAPAVKQQLNVSDDAELAAVMAEITRLAHTPEFSDKEVGYIVWKKQADLAKLVSPKKPSFEGGGHQGDAPADEELNLTSGAGVTPAMMERAKRTGGSRTELEHRKAS